MKKINWNDRVKVKLTELGKDIYYHRNDHITDRNGKRMLERHFPVVDEDGFFRISVMGLYANIWQAYRYGIS